METKMKDRIIMIISTLMLFIPWTILYLRTFDWALESPAAEIMIISYGVFMIFSGIFTIWAYTKGRVKNIWMQICSVINGIYAAGGAAILCIIAIQHF